MNAMYLTDKKKGIVREFQNHEELEVLLESFSKQVEEVVTEAENIQVRLSQPLQDFTNSGTEQCTIHSRNSGTNTRF